MVQKEFVLNFIMSYMPLAFTAFVYLPFGHVLTPYLNFWASIAETLTFGRGSLSVQKFRSDPGRITKQMFYNTVTAQIVNFATEAIVPYVKKQFTNKAMERGIVGGKPKVAASDAKDEADFLAKVREEAGLEAYDVTGDYREMVVQFGMFPVHFTWHDSLSPCSLEALHRQSLHFQELLHRHEGSYIRGNIGGISRSLTRPCPWPSVLHISLRFL
jgi:hypothetical protein